MFWTGLFGLRWSMLHPLSLPNSLWCFFSRWKRPRPRWPWPSTKPPSFFDLCPQNLAVNGSRISPLNYFAVDPVLNMIYIIYLHLYHRLSIFSIVSSFASYFFTYTYVDIHINSSRNMSAKKKLYCMCILHYIHFAPKLNEYPWDFATTVTDRIIEKNKVGKCPGSTRAFASGKKNKSGLLVPGYFPTPG